MLVANSLPSDQPLPALYSHISKPLARIPSHASPLQVFKHPLHRHLSAFELLRDTLTSWTLEGKRYLNPPPIPPMSFFTRTTEWLTDEASRENASQLVRQVLKKAQTAVSCVHLSLLYALSAFLPGCLHPQLCPNSNPHISHPTTGLNTIVWVDLSLFVPLWLTNGNHCKRLKHQGGWEDGKMELNKSFSQVTSLKTLGMFAFLQVIVFSSSPSSPPNRFYLKCCC